MNKEQILKVIKLLSALEACGMLNPNRIPDYLLEDLDKAIEVLTAEILK